jgi:hypothetical protein
MVYNWFINCSHLHLNFRTIRQVCNQLTIVPVPVVLIAPPLAGAVGVAGLIGALAGLPLLPAHGLVLTGHSLQ